MPLVWRISPPFAELFMANRITTDRAVVRRRSTLKLVLALAAATMSVVPGDAVAHPGAGALSADRSGAKPPRTSAAPQTRLLLSDMSQPSERLPAGVPTSYDWAQHPRTEPMKPLPAFRAFAAWGQLYQCAGTASTPHATVDFRNLQTWVLRRSSSAWERAQVSSNLGGAAFPEDFAGPAVAGRYWASPAGISAQLVPGRNFHFWSDSGRVSINRSDVKAVTVALEARLDPNTAKASNPCLVLSVGGDMWTTLWGGNSSSGDVGIGRFKRVERRWRLFTMTTASPELMRQIPVPQLAPPGEEF